MLKTRKVPRLYIIHNAVASYPNFDAFEAAMQESPSISRTEFLCKIEHAGVLEMPQGIGNYDAVRPIQTPAAWLWVKSEERCNFGNSAYHLTVFAQRERVRKTMKKERPQRDRQKPKRERGGGILRRKRVVRSPNAPEKAMIFGVSVTTKKCLGGRGMRRSECNSLTAPRCGRLNTLNGSSMRSLAASSPTAHCPGGAKICWEKEESIRDFRPWSALEVCERGYRSLRKSTRRRSTKRNQE